MQFISILSIFAVTVASTTSAVPHMPRQSATNGTVPAAAIGMSMGCTVMANACTFYIKSVQCSDEWVKDVHK